MALSSEQSHRFQFWESGLEKVISHYFDQVLKMFFSEAKNVFKLIREMSDVEIEQLQNSGSCTLGGHSITSNEVSLFHIDLS